jgi:hypothetical protein
MSITRLFSHIALIVGTLWFTSPLDSQTDAGASLALVTSAADAKAELRPAASFEGGTLYKAGKMNVLRLSGNYRKMGRQYGALLKNDFSRFYQLSIEEYLLKSGGLGSQGPLKYEYALDFAKKYLSRFPKRLQDLIYGMAETSGLPLEKHILLNTVDLLEIFAAAPRDHCSAIFAWNEYTGGGPLVAGRNYDYPNIYRAWAPYLVTAIFAPDDGSIPTASIAYLGAAYTQNGFSKSGIFLEFNTAVIEPMIIRNDRVPNVANLLCFLLDSPDYACFDAAFQSTLTDYPSIIQAADPNAAHSYEWLPAGLKRQDGDRAGLLIATNHILDPSWRERASDNSVQRRTNLRALAERYRGRFNVDAMKQVLAVPLDQGGATSREDTIYQIIALPAARQLWLKEVGFQDWILLDLNKLF